jgi:hypothetical protein
VFKGPSRTCPKTCNVRVVTEGFRATDGKIRTPHVVSLEGQRGVRNSDGENVSRRDHMQTQKIRAVYKTVLFSDIRWCISSLKFSSYAT